MEIQLFKSVEWLTDLLYVRLNVFYIYHVAEW